MKLNDISYLVNEKIRSNSITIDQYITVDNLLQNKNGRTVALNLPPNTCSLTKFQKGDVLVGNIRPYLKKIWYADIDGGASNDVLVFRAKEGHSDKYLYSVLLQDSFFDYVMAGCKGSKMPRGEKNHIINFEIEHIDAKQEVIIGNTIESIMDLITVNKHTNEVLEKIAKQLYDYWFVQFDFPDKNGKPYKSSGGKMIYNSQLKREIPEGWEVKSFSDIAELKNDSIVPVPDVVYNHYSIPAFDDGNLFVSEYGSAISSNKFIMENDEVLVSKLNPRINRVLFSDNKDNNICSTEYVIIKPTITNDKYYIYTVLKQPSYIRFSDKAATGTSNSHKRCNPSIIMSFKMPYKSDIVNLFTKKVSSYYDKMIENKKQISSLTSLRDFLLPMLMNGQISVK